MLCVAPSVPCFAQQGDCGPTALASASSVGGREDGLSQVKAGASGHELVEDRSVSISAKS